MIDTMTGSTVYLGTPLAPRVVAFAPNADGTVTITQSTFTWNYGELTDFRTTTDLASARQQYRQYLREGYVRQDGKFANSRKGR